jgi:hypothetical protein
MVEAISKGHPFLILVFSRFWFNIILVVDEDTTETLFVMLLMAS